MNHAEALALALRGSHKVAALALGLSPSLIDMQCRGERPSAGDRLERIVSIAREQGSPDADAPIATLLDRLGYLPPIRREAIDGATTPTELAELMRAAADLIDAKADSVAGGETDEEAARLDRTLARVSYLVTRERMELELRAATRKAPKRAPRANRPTDRRRATA